MDVMASISGWALNWLILRLFNNTVPTADVIFSIIALKDYYEWRVNQNLKKGDHALLQGTILAFRCTAWEKLQDTSIANPTGIQNSQVTSWTRKKQLCNSTICWVVLEIFILASQHTERFCFLPSDTGDKADQRLMVVINHCLMLRLSVIFKNSSELSLFGTSTQG